MSISGSFSKPDVSPNQIAVESEILHGSSLVDYLHEIPFGQIQGYINGIIPVHSNGHDFHFSGERSFLRFRKLNIGDVIEYPDKTTRVVTEHDNLYFYNNLDNAYDTLAHISTVSTTARANDQLTFNMGYRHQCVELARVWMLLSKRLLLPDVPVAAEIINRVVINCMEKPNYDILKKSSLEDVRSGKTVTVLPSYNFGFSPKDVPGLFDFNQKKFIVASNFNADHHGSIGNYPPLKDSLLIFPCIPDFAPWGHVAVITAVIVNGSNNEEIIMDGLNSNSPDSHIIKYDGKNNERIIRHLPPGIHKVQIIDQNQLFHRYQQNSQGDYYSMECTLAVSTQDDGSYSYTMTAELNGISFAPLGWISFPHIPNSQVATVKTTNDQHQPILIRTFEPLIFAEQYHIEPLFNPIHLARVSITSRQMQHALKKRESKNCSDENCPEQCWLNLENPAEKKFMDTFGISVTRARMNEVDSNYYLANQELALNLISATQSLHHTFVNEASLCVVKSINSFFYDLRSKFFKEKFNDVTTFPESQNTFRTKFGSEYLIQKFGMAHTFWKRISQSYKVQKKTILTGRFDFAVNNEKNELKTFEYNADSAATLLECGRIQAKYSHVMGIEYVSKNLLELIRTGKYLDEKGDLTPEAKSLKFDEDEILATSNSSELDEFHTRDMGWKMESLLIRAWQQFFHNSGLLYEKNPIIHFCIDKDDEEMYTALYALELAEKAKLLYNGDRKKGEPEFELKLKIEVMFDNFKFAEDQPPEEIIQEDENGEKQRLRKMHRILDEDGMEVKYIWKTWAWETAFSSYKEVAKERMALSHPWVPSPSEKVTLADLLLGYHESDHLDPDLLLSRYYHSETYPDSPFTKEAFLPFLDRLSPSDFQIETIYEMRTVLEPLWKSIPSNKAILPIVWSINSCKSNRHLETDLESKVNCTKYLLRSEYKLDEDLIRAGYVAKPIVGRTGYNITVVDSIEKHAKLLSEGKVEVREGTTLGEDLIFDNFNNVEIVHSLGKFADRDQIYQNLFPLKRMDGYYAIIGGWVIGPDGDAGGFGIREDHSVITGLDSPFSALRSTTS